MNLQLQATPYYPFTLNGPLSPLLNDAEVLASFYAEESLRHGIKQFCKRTAWPDKPVVSYAVDPEKLKELLLSLFNSPIARTTLRQQSETGRCPYLDNAIWQWLTVVNPSLSQRLSDCCDEIKGKLFLRQTAWVALLAKIKAEKPSADVVTQLAYLTLAFAMLQPDDRHSLSEAFLTVFPECKAKLLGA
ncbi:MAG: hypothetical protein WCG79_02050 [Verrucomicrobiota bacterium]|jgi:hypothetical protein